MKIKGDYLLAVLVFLILSFQAVETTPVCDACHFMVTEVQKSMPIGPFDILLRNIGL